MWSGGVLRQTLIMAYYICPEDNPCLRGLRKRACTYGPDILWFIISGIKLPYVGRLYDTEIAPLRWHYTIRHIGCILGLLSADSTWCRCRDWFETASAHMSYIKAKFVIPLLELNLIGVGYVSYVQVVHTSLNPKHRGYFFIADEYCDCSQFILSFGGEGCSGPAHLAVLTLNSIRWVSYTLHNFRALSIISVQDLNHQRSESRSDIRCYSAVHTIPNTTQLSHEVQYRLHV
jgi:hypothetical protein